ASWTEEEETSFINFLISEAASSGDEGFNKTTFQEAASKLNSFNKQVEKKQVPVAKASSKG
ncbi:hypothetical protein PAXRUDRAFT_155678, partial [Paxillus rubicundulus Ve08.2h10]